MHLFQLAPFLAQAGPSTGDHAAALIVTTLFFIVGYIGTFLPGVPGSFIIWLGIIIYRFWLGDAGLPWSFVFISGILVLFVYLFDLVSTAWGARKFGATWRGAVGAILGGLIGFFIPPPLLWLILGPILGAMLGELLGGRRLADAGRAGFGTVVGALVGLLFKLTVTTFVIGWFYWDVIMK
jgi:hypothetical protein